MVDRSHPLGPEDADQTSEQEDLGTMSTMGSFQPIRSLVASPFLRSYSRPSTRRRSTLDDVSDVRSRGRPTPIFHRTWQETTQALRNAVDDVTEVVRSCPRETLLMQFE
jgi:hypothetical protein